MYLKKNFFSIHPSHLLPPFFPGRWIYWGGGSMTLGKRWGGYQYFAKLYPGGGFPCTTWGGGMGAVSRGRFTLPSFLVVQLIFCCSATPMFPFWSFFAGVGLAEAGQLIMQGGLQTRGGSSALRKRSACWDGSSSGWFRGGGFLWASEGSDITLLPPHILTSPKKAPCAPSATVSHLPPQESIGPEASAPAEQALESASLALPPASEDEIPAHMQPLCIQLGASKGCTDVRLRAAKRAHQPLVLPSVLTYERYIWEWG